MISTISILSMSQLRLAFDSTEQDTTNSTVLPYQIETDYLIVDIPGQDISKLLQGLYLSFQVNGSRIDISLANIYRLGIDRAIRGVINDDNLYVCIQDNVYIRSDKHIISVISTDVNTIFDIVSQADGTIKIHPSICNIPKLLRIEVLIGTMHRSIDPIYLQYSTVILYPPTILGAGTTISYKFYCGSILLRHQPIINMMLGKKVPEFSIVINQSHVCIPEDDDWYRYDNAIFRIYSNYIINYINFSGSIGFRIPITDRDLKETVYIKNEYQTGNGLAKCITTSLRIAGIEAKYYSTDDLIYITRFGTPCNSIECPLLTPIDGIVGYYTYILQYVTPNISYCVCLGDILIEVNADNHCINNLIGITLSGPLLMRRPKELDKFSISISFF